MLRTQDFARRMFARPHWNEGVADLVLLTGAARYVGGRLRRLLKELGDALRCLSRRTAGLAPRVAPTTELVAGDVLMQETLAPALDGVNTAYYLIHSMGSVQDFEE